MKNKQEEMQGMGWLFISLLLALSLAVNAVRALSGLEKFAWWHLATLLILTEMTVVSLTERQRARIKAYFRLTRLKAAEAFSDRQRVIVRAVRGLAALFTLRPYHRHQTEP